jgi:hypothetical protein
MGERDGRVAGGSGTARGIGTELGGPAPAAR